MSVKSEEPRLTASQPFILVALDASEASQAALESCVELAARLGADLRGLFVEDTQWLDAAAIPYTQGVGSFSAATRQFDVDDVERQMRALARSARHSLAQRADAAGVRWSFEVVRGLVSVELVRRASGAEFFGLGALGSSWPRLRHRLGRTLQGALKQRGLSLVVLAPKPRQAPTVVVTCDQLSRVDAALRLALPIARGQGAGVTLILHGTAPADLRGSGRETPEWTNSAGLIVLERPGRSLSSLADEVNLRDAGWLLVATDRSLEENILRLLAQGPGRLVILRRG